MEKKFFYRLGVLSFSTTLKSFRYDNFESMSNEMTKIKKKYCWDMARCTFVVQAYKDNSYDFYNSCFLQEEFSVNAWDKEKETWLKEEITNQYGEENGSD